MEEPKWLLWAREIQAIAQTGLAFSKDQYDLERYQRLRAITVEMLAEGAGAPIERIATLFDGEVGYATPKVDVRGAVFRDDRILLVREVSNGRWSLPGGWADVNQTPRESVEREIEEESGYTARARKLVGVWDYRHQGQGAPHAYSIYKLFFLCELTGGSARPSAETSAVEFFSIDRLPELSVGRVNPEQIRRVYQHRDNPQLQTEFD